MGKLQFEWILASDALPHPDKEVLVLDGQKVAISQISYISNGNDRSSKDGSVSIRWHGGITPTHWAFIPQAPHSTVAEKGDGPSVW